MVRDSWGKKVVFVGIEILIGVEDNLELLIVININLIVLYVWLVNFEIF